MQGMLLHPVTVLFKWPKETSIEDTAGLRGQSNMSNNDKIEVSREEWERLQNTVRSLKASRAATGLRPKSRGSTYRRPGAAMIRAAVKARPVNEIAGELDVHPSHVYQVFRERGVSHTLYQAMVKHGWLKPRTRLCVDMSPAERDAFRRMVAEEGKTVYEFILDLVDKWEWDNLVFEDEEYERARREQY